MPEQERHIIKACSCGKDYTRDEWQQLDLTRRHNGRLKFEDGYTYEFRHCAGCHSTLAITVRMPSSSSIPVVRPMQIRPSSHAPPDLVASAMLRIPRDAK